MLLPLLPSLSQSGPPANLHPGLLYYHCRPDRQENLDSWHFAQAAALFKVTCWIARHLITLAFEHVDRGAASSNTPQRG